MSYYSPFGRRMMACAMLAALGACHPGHGGQMPGDSDDHAPFQGIGMDETISLYGTEPFWGGKVQGESLTYTTPDNPEGTTVPVSRFAGRGGLSYSGELEGRSLTLALTPGQCSDGMSDRRYPYTATLRLGDDLRRGCAATDR